MANDLASFGSQLLALFTTKGRRARTFQALGILAFLSLIFWLTTHNLSSLSSPDPVADWFEHRDPRVIVATLTMLMITAPVIFLLLLDKVFGIGQLPATHPFHWLKLLFGFCVLAEASWFVGVYVQYQHYSDFNTRYPIYFSALLRVNCAALLLITGIGLYLLKQQSKMVYGLSEIAVALTSNIALIKNIDLSRAPTISLHTTDFVGLAVFTYLLSRGISNVSEGIDELRSSTSGGGANPVSSGS
jgi:hypothetical protein